MEGEGLKLHLRDWTPAGPDLVQVQSKLLSDAAPFSERCKALLRDRNVEAEQTFFLF